LVSNGLVHACDISTSLREFDLSTIWADLLFEEFFKQGDCEKAQGLEVSMLCDRETTKVAGGQEGFIEFVVMPIFITLSNIVPEIKDVQLDSGKKNLTHWRNRVETEKKLAEKEEKMKQIMSQAGRNNRSQLVEASSSKDTNQGGAKEPISAGGSPKAAASNAEKEQATEFNN
jgi:hypothetical protein